MSRYKTMLETVRTIALAIIAGVLLDPCTPPASPDQGALPGDRHLGEHKTGTGPEGT